MTKILFKAIAFILIASCLLISFAGCDGEKETPTQSSSKASTSATSGTSGTTATTSKPSDNSDNSDDLDNSEGTEVNKNDLYEYKIVQNPVIAGKADDPFVTCLEGQYYYCFSANGAVYVRKMADPLDFPKEGTEVWRPAENTAYSQHLWAPEMHYIDGAWYIYVACDDGDDNNHKMYVLKREGKDPIGAFTFMGVIEDSANPCFAIDGTILYIGEKMYFLWSGHIAYGNRTKQNIYIAEMSDPCTLATERHLISTADYDWEKRDRSEEASGGLHVNEGPIALYRNDKTFIVYSASGSWGDYYCLGLLTYNGGDPLEKSSWEKSPEPVFEKVDDFLYGPGHCSFAQAPDGETLMYYHANLVSDSGSNGRYGCIAQLRWDEKDMPIFDPPAEVLKIAVKKK